MSSSTQDSLKEQQARSKAEGRESRLSFRNLAENELKKRMKEEAKEKCADYIKTFAKCGEETGIMVVFRCQSQLKALNGCMAVHNGDEAWQKYKEAHKEELLIRSKGEKI